MPVGEPIETYGYEHHAPRPMGRPGRLPRRSGRLAGTPPVMSTEVDRLIHEFCGYLGSERGLAAGSVTLYDKWVG